MGILVDRYVVPPFSILDTRQGYWQKRKAFWLDQGIRGQEGRKNKSNKVELFKYYSDVNRFTKKNKKQPLKEVRKTVSVFDPVLTEIAYKWFNVESGSVLDPFAGGSVRGWVAAKLGHDYVGVDIRKEQIDANYKQVKNKKFDGKLKWIEGNSYNLSQLVKKDDFDYVFTCPPYYDLEIYSNDAQDLSAFETYEKFLSWYKEIFQQCVSKLKDNRFLTVVVGDIRDKKGNYRGFVADNIRIFEELGLKLYNEAILVNQVASASARCQSAFCPMRKLAKTHQNILVFYKGSNSRNIKKDFHNFGYQRFNQKCL